MKIKDIRKRDIVMRDNLDDLSVPIKKRLLKMRDKSKQAITTVFGKVRRIEHNGKFAQVKWLGQHATTREPLRRLTTIKRKGIKRA